MKFPQLFLTNMAKDQKEFLNLLDLTAKVHGEPKTLPVNSKTVIWDEDFHHLTESAFWHSLPLSVREGILVRLGQKILQEAYFIECAGMAYAGKMNLASKTKEERAFFCFVAEEETKHLRMIEALASFNTSLETIPSFALLIGEIIQEASKASHLLLIQILLEGWGLSYYKNLSKASRDESVSNAFKSIVKDEIRHHSGGVLLFSSRKLQHPMTETEVSEFLGYLERIAFMVKVGPYALCEEVMKFQEGSDKEVLNQFLIDINAVTTTQSKMELLRDLLSKSLPEEVFKLIEDRKILRPMNLNEMREALAEAIL